MDKGGGLISCKVITACPSESHGTIIFYEHFSPALKGKLSTTCIMYTLISPLHTGTILLAIGYIIKVNQINHENQ